MMNRFRRTSATATKNSSTSSSNSSHSQPTKRRIFGRTSNSHSNSSLQNPPLSQFDACIEACDALAASSSRQTSALVLEREDRPSFEEDIADNAVESVPDCSMLVSPDGALLFTSSTHPRSKDNDNEEGERYPWIKSSSHHAAIEHERQEYESAILTGNDLTPGGDYDSNGFSGRGWDVDAASDALRANRGVMESMEMFVEGVALCEKQRGAGLIGCCGVLSDGLDRLRAQQSQRQGPILAEGSSLANALLEMEQYYYLCAESATEHWREACCDDHHRKPSSSLHRTINETTDRNNDGIDTNRAIDASLIQGLLPRMKLAVKKAEERTRERELALNDIRSKVTEAQDALMKQKVRATFYGIFLVVVSGHTHYNVHSCKICNTRVIHLTFNTPYLIIVKEWSSAHWKRVKEENRKIDEIVNQHVREQNEVMRKLRQEKEAARLEHTTSENAMSEHDLWEMVKGIGSMEDFEHTGYSPRSPRGVSPPADGIEYEKKEHVQTGSHLETEADLPRVPEISRSDIEKESDIHELRRAALEADDLVEDAAAALLNIMSKRDTTMRSARVAAETGLLSQCNAAHRCLRSIVEIERASLQERMERFQKLEAAVNAVDVRRDLDAYIQHDKLLPGGTSRGADTDDGGIASALAVLNSHIDDFFDVNRTNITRPNYFKGWSDAGEDENDNEEMEPDFFKAVIKMIFERKLPDGAVEDEKTQQKLKNALSNLNSVLLERNHQGRTSRQAVLYELNNQRSFNTEIEDYQNFESLCMIFDAFLTGCGRESIDVSNAKMLMILSQTFFFVDHGDHDHKSDRTARVYVKNKISSHDIWADDDFWDQALYQCVAESLKKSGVLLNYVKPRDDSSAQGELRQIKWHDLSPNEYADAAAQVHSVVFAQLGTLSHSMLELGCGISRACSFVRRLSIRYQLPLSLRVTLIQHLTKNTV
ncbi:hypothetical protein ACHAW6_010396 [Cyclotella cf. meneghiniana]